MDGPDHAARIYSVNDAGVANGSISFRSSEYADWVRLEDVIAWDNERTRMRREGVRQILNDGPWDEVRDQGTAAELGRGARGVRNTSYLRPTSSALS